MQKLFVLSTVKNLFRFAKAACLQYLGKEMDCFGFPSLEIQNGFLKRRSSPAASVVGKVQALLAAAVDADNPNDEDYDWNAENALSLCDIKCVGAKRCLHDF